MAYDEKYRKRVLEYIEEGHSQKEVSEIFAVSVSTIREWKKLWKETGSLQKRPLKRGFKKIDPEKLTAYAAKYPDAYLKEIAGEFKCDEKAIRKALIRLKITRKKRPGNTKKGTK
jgi:transposase